MTKHIPLRRPVSIILALLMLIIAFMPTGLGTIRAFGASETFSSVTGGVSPYNVDTVWLHYRSDGALAYCRQKGLSNPDGTSGEYYINNWEPGEQSMVAAIFANADSIAASYGISGDYKRALIQMTIWTITNLYESYNPSLSSVTSSDPVMLSALHALHNAALSGYSAVPATISGLPNGGRLVGSVYGNYVRYGPFSVSNSKSASADAADAPAGSFFGNASGAAVNKDNLANGQQFYFYIPLGAGSTIVPRITIRAWYDTMTVTKYSGFWGYQDQYVGGDPGSAEISTSGTLRGFGEAEVWKHDDENDSAALCGAVFEIDQWSNASAGWRASGVAVTWNESIRRYKTGVLIETIDNEGRFRIRETGVPYSYLSGWSEEISVHTQYGAAFKLHADNTPVKLKINLFKLDRNTGKGLPQGDATLEGAVYGLFMNEDREHPNGTKYEVGQKIAEAATDTNGMVIFDDLFPAKYYIIELSPSEGYLLDDTVYEVDGTHDGVEKSVHRNISVTEQVKKQKFELIKVGISEAETEVSLLGAGFKIYLISELEGVKDGSLLPKDGEWSYKDFKGYDFTGEQTAKIDSISTPEFFSNSLGHFISPELPYGKYVVVESTTPAGYMTIDPFIVMITEDSREAQPWRIFDDKEIRYYIRIIKKDTETGNTILNKSAAYRIYDLDKKEYVHMKTTYPNTVWHGTANNPYKTDETGMLITPEKLVYGHYRLEEVTAPEGYVLSGHEQVPEAGYNPKGKTTANPAEPVYIEYGDSIPVYLPDADVDVLEVIQYNEQQKGRIYIYKHGDKPDVVSVDKNGNMVFRYTDEPLEGVVFSVIADGDITSQDGSDKVLHKSGDVVATLTTDKEGHVWSGDLYIGNYILREIDAPEGYLFVPDEAFSILPIEQTKQFTFLSYDLTDKRQRLDIEIVKTEEGSGRLLAGAVFTLYAAEEISFGLAAGEGGFLSNVIGALSGALFGEKFNVIEKDAAIATAVTGDDGRAVFTNLPPGKYYVKETKAPNGYIINTAFCPEFELAYDKGGTEILVWKATCKNAKPQTSTPPVQTPAPVKGSVPKTGDGFSAALWIVLVCAATAGAIASALVSRRKKKDTAGKYEEES